MNERIKEFEKQCWDHQTNHLNARKFAELIVEECANLIDSMDHSSQYFPHVADAIKKHFGVKQ
jgi:hypothetical protein